MQNSGLFRSVGYRPPPPRLVGRLSRNARSVGEIRRFLARIYSRPRVPKRSEHARLNCSLFIIALSRVLLPPPLSRPAGVSYFLL